MRLMVYVNDEGITDDTFKDGDIFQVHDDSWEPGESEKQRWLVVQIDESTGASQNELVSPEYNVGPDNQPILRRMRKYRLNYAARLTPEQLTAARDLDTTVEVVTGIYTMGDIARK